MQERQEAKRKKKEAKKDAKAKAKQKKLDAKRAKKESAETAKKRKQKAKAKHGRRPRSRYRTKLSPKALAEHDAVVYKNERAKRGDRTRTSEEEKEAKKLIPHPLSQFQAKFFEDERMLERQYTGEGNDLPQMDLELPLHDTQMNLEIPVHDIRVDPPRLEIVTSSGIPVHDTTRNEELDAATTPQSSGRHVRLFVERGRVGDINPKPSCAHRIGRCLWRAMTCSFGKKRTSDEHPDGIPDELLQSKSNRRVRFNQFATRYAPDALSPISEGKPANSRRKTATKR